MRVYTINPMDSTVIKRTVMKEDIRVHEEYDPETIVREILLAILMYIVKFCKNAFTLIFESISRVANFFTRVHVSDYV